ncbi:MAG: sulfate transporter CysZ [Candidatus Brocadiaceae bacterium]|nr:sulfate transporter CysZ [Candidatus Brocadiaceae bacterium]
MKNSIFQGPAYILRGFNILTNPGLKRYIILPIIINILVFIGIGWFAASEFQGFMDQLLPEGDSWFFIPLDLIRWILWPLFAITFLFVIFYTFTIVANLLASPFNGLLSEKVELILTGESPSQAPSSVISNIWPALISEAVKILYFLVRAIPLLLLFVIPVVNLAAPFIWLLFMAWYMTLEYSDYPMGNHGLSFKEQRNQLKKVRFTAIGFGGGITFLMLIPILNFFVMPAAVAGATIFWCEHHQDLETKL